MFLEWFKSLFKDEEPEPVRQVRHSAASITAMIDNTLEKMDKETTECGKQVQVASRRAVNVSRRIIASTGQYQVPNPRT